MPWSKVGAAKGAGMNFVVIGKDKGNGEHRARHRAAHLEYIAERQEPIVYAGPLIENGRMVGSLFVFDVADRSALDQHLAQDPYFSERIFETVEIYESRWMVPEREPGFLRAEAAKARGITPP
jgi:uncharacterized protein YciI